MAHPRFVAGNLTTNFIAEEFKGGFTAEHLPPGDPAMLAAIAEHRPALVFLSYPNNPTGNLFDAEQIVAIIPSSSERYLSTWLFADVGVESDSLDDLLPPAPGRGDGVSPSIPDSHLHSVRGVEIFFDHLRPSASPVVASVSEWFCLMLRSGRPRQTSRANHRALSVGRDLCRALRVSRPVTSFNRPVRMSMPTRLSLSLPFSVRALLASVGSLAAVAALPAQTPTSPAKSAKEEPVALEAFVTLGSRFNQRTVVDSAVPIDVLTEREIRQGGYTETAKVLQSQIPSFNNPHPTTPDGNTHVRSATLRGLSPDQTLVLVNGKRRHTSALVNLNGSVGCGSSAVDLNAFPPSAIGSIEVLRDGAAAQYGSDAIAGVINLILRKDTGGRSRSTHSVAPPMMEFCGAAATSADVELGIGQNIGAGARRAQEDAAFALLEARLRHDVAAAVVEHHGLLPFRQLRDVAHHQRIVEGEHGIEATATVGFRGHFDVVEQ
eukprot:gene35961-48372_t